MLQSYIKIAIRNLLRSKLFSFINLSGLAIGMTCCMLLLLYIRSETTFDRHQAFARNLYLVNSQAVLSSGAKEEFPMLSAPYAAAIKTEFPEILQVSRLWGNMIEDKAMLQVREAGKPVRSFYETRGYQADSTFFDLFTYQFTEGNARSALRDPHSIVLSEELASQLFGKIPALNKTIAISGITGGGELFNVTGVYRDESRRSHIDARFFVPLSAGWVGGFLRNQPQNFSHNNMFYTYLRLRADADPKQLEKKLPAFIKKYAGKDLKADGFDKNLFLIPVPEIHLYSKLQNIVTPTNSRTYLYILASIAVFTLLIACINFMNLSTARSAKRAAEVGIRKVMGAGKGALIRQFLGESMVLALLSLVLAVGLLTVLLPSFNLLTGKGFIASDLMEPRIIVAFIILALVTGLIAGSYPAFYLSVFNPVQVLKGKFVNSISAVTLRRGLIVFQFVISIGLVLATIVIQRQMQFLRDQPLGFTKSQQIVIPIRSEEAHKAYTTLRTEILRGNEVLGATGTQYYPGIPNATDYSLYRPDQTVNDLQSVRMNAVAPDFLQLMGFQLIKGRLFSENNKSDTNGRMVVNETTLHKFSIPLEKAIGQKLYFNFQGQTQTLEIVGVVKDFHFEDLHQAIQPYAFLLNNNTDFNYLIVHVKTERVQNTIAFLENKWKTVRPDEPFEYSFLDEDFQRNYHAEVRTSHIVSWFTSISIFLSCLGLFGLAAFAAQQRTKEIGIRKVLGATVGDITTLLSKDFIRPVLLALVIASPLSWHFMHKWLEGFAYKTNIPWWIFVLAGVIALAIALITVSVQAVKAALANPATSLKSE
ncbi:ABC transporter permease [Flavitalea flava]